MLILGYCHRFHHRCRALLASKQSAEDGSLVECELEGATNDSGELFRFEGGGDADEVSGPVTSGITVSDECEPFVGLFSRFVLAVDGPGGVELVLVNDDDCSLSLHTRFLSTKESSSRRMDQDGIILIGLDKRTFSQECTHLQQVRSVSRLQFDVLLNPCEHQHNPGIPWSFRATLGGIDSGNRIENGKSC